MWFFTFPIGKALKELSHPSSERVYINSHADTLLVKASFTQFDEVK